VKVIAPRHAPPKIASGGSASARLPDDIVAEQVRRLTAFCVVSAALWGVALLMDLFVFPDIETGAINWRIVQIEIGSVVFALTVLVYVRFAPLPSHLKTDGGLWLMVMNAAAVAMLENWAYDPTAVPFRNLSWIVVVILVSAMILPNRPRKMLLASMIAASMGPVTIWLAYLNGAAVPPASGLLAMCLPNYTCALAAVLPSLMFQRLGRRLREARELGNYQLVEEIGRGGMGEVWLARHRLLARPAAIKLVPPEVLGAATTADIDEALRRFEREAQATAALTSQHSIRLFDFGATDDGSFFYVMELLTGRSLDSLVKTFGPLPPERALYLLRQVCHSLAEAHAKGLVHGDVKPANIFICRMGLDYDFVKVLDFGLVHFVEPHPTDAVTRTAIAVDHIMGTPGYIAPETIVSPGKADGRADIYALGCVAYFMLTGTLVFPRESSIQGLADHLHASPTPPSQRASLPLPRSVDTLVLACLEKEPARRPQQASDVLQRIADCQLADAWSSERARGWWTLNLPELADADTDSPVRAIPSPSLT
jgi:serine/threonine-protein kinase